MDRISNVDLQEALTKIANSNTFYHLDNDIKISFDEMTLAAKMGDYTDKAFIWVSYPSGIDFYNEREVLQKDTRAFNGVLYHGRGAESEPKLAYAVDAVELRNGTLYGDLYEIDISKYAAFVADNSVTTDKMQVFYDDVRRNDKNEVMPLKEFNSRYPLDLPQMVHWRNLPQNADELNNVLDKVWNNRLSDASQVTLWQHTDKLDDKQLAFYANQLMKGLDKTAEPNSADKQSFTFPLDARASHNFNPVQLSRLLDKLPYENTTFAIHKGQDSMKIVVPKNEVLKIRKEQEQEKEQDKQKPQSRTIAKPDEKAERNEKSEKPSLMAALDKGEKKSKAEFGGKANPGVDTLEKSTKKNNDER